MSCQPDDTRINLEAFKSRLLTTALERANKNGKYCDVKRLIRAAGYITEP